MTVKELKEILDACNDDAIVMVQSDNVSPDPISDNQIWAVPDGKTVIIDLNLTYNEVNQ